MTLKKIKKIPSFIAKHIFEFSLFALLLTLIIGVILFYKYSILAQKIGIESLPQTCLLEEKSYQKVLDIWTKNEQTFNQADSENYYDIFDQNID